MLHQQWQDRRDLANRCPTWANPTILLNRINSSSSSNNSHRNSSSRISNLHRPHKLSRNSHPSSRPNSTLANRECHPCQRQRDLFSISSIHRVDPECRSNSSNHP